MKCGQHLRLISFLAVLILGVLATGCDDNQATGTSPSDYTPMIASVELTPAVEAGAPISLTGITGKLAIAYSAVFTGTGDIYRLVLCDKDADGIFESYASTEYYPNESDTTIHYTIADQTQFTWIGAYEGENDSPSYPADIFFTGPKQLIYDQDTDRIFYSLIFDNYPQIASTQGPVAESDSLFNIVINSYDPILEEISTPAGRVPIWDFWYTVVNQGDLEYPDFGFSGGNSVTVSQYQNGNKWIAYSDSVRVSSDLDGDGEIDEDRPGVIEIWQNIDELIYPINDGLPGYAGVDDDQDGLADLDDLEVAAMLFYNPAFPPVKLDSLLMDADLDPVEREALVTYLSSLEHYAWELQNYNGAYDDDEDGRMDEDPLEQIDNDGDGMISEDELEPQINNDIDDKLDEDGPDPNIIAVDNDGDGLFDEDGPEGPPVDNDSDGLFDEDPEEERIDNDDDGLFDEDSAEEPIDNDDDGLIDEDPSEQVDNDGDGQFSEDPVDGVDNDGDSMIDEDPAEVEIDNDGDGRFSEDGPDQIDNDGDGLFSEDSSEQIDNDGDGLLNEDPSEQIDNDGDGLINEDPTEQLDDDGDGLIDEDPSEQIDNDGDGTAWSEIIYSEGGDILSYIAEDGREIALDNDGDGLRDEDGPGDLTDYPGSTFIKGFPGFAGVDDDGDGFMDWDDPEVRHSTLRAERLRKYIAALDDDEDGISDEDGDVYGSGIWVVKIKEDGAPNHRVAPISLTNDQGSQPVFNPVDNDLLYVLSGDIYRLTLEFSADTVIVTGSENLTNTGTTFENFPSYSEDGTKIVYCSNAFGSSDIWTMNHDGSGQVRVTNDPGQEILPSFTPAGNQILYEAWLFPDGARRVMITTGALP